jgi:hypothetical protein
LSVSDRPKPASCRVNFSTSACHSIATIVSTKSSEMRANSKRDVMETEIGNDTFRFIETVFSVC